MVSQPPSYVFLYNAARVTSAEVKKPGNLRGSIGSIILAVRSIMESLEVHTRFIGEKIATVVTKLTDYRDSNAKPVVNGIPVH